MTIATLLIANRGEIACRVIRTARRMGMRTVAVYSDADRDALHVAEADEAVRIGPAAASQSYLDIEAVVEAARRTGADAIHPGYGFLSENAAFVEAVEAAGLVFVGPSASAIRAMGLKDAAKALMANAGVPVVPGYHGAEQDPALLKEEAAKIGYPVLVKARAGGGGKGMREVHRPEDFETALAAAQREAKASFGDPRCLIEKLVATPRHIEIQVFGDTHGNVVHLFERDCSLQRRHQKVIEEAPAPGMTKEMREAMGAAAARAAKAVDYAGAGTVEFIADASEGLRPDRFWFMEMNTRLQVEHPVTEAITGLDVVELQLRVASGEPLPFTQQDLAIDGHAFEARIYAEDPEKGFLPSTGRLDYLSMPRSVRIDTGVREGDTITPFYDPMIAKLVVHGADRAAALGKLSAALRQTRIAGLSTNAAFLWRLAENESFRNGAVDTGLIERDRERLLVASETSHLAVALAALSALDRLRRDPHPASDPFDTLHGFRAWGRARQTVRFEARDGETLAVTVVDAGKGRFSIEAAGVVTDIAVEDPGPPSSDTSKVAFSIGDRRRTAFVVRHADAVTVFLDGETCRMKLRRPEAAVDGASGGDRVVAPMPGRVVQISTTVGDTVRGGDALLVLEAMKMEHALKSPRDGVVERVAVSVGDQVEDGATMVVLTDREG